MSQVYSGNYFWGPSDLDIWISSDLVTCQRETTILCDVRESQVIIESPGPSRSLNIRQATPRMSQNVCRTPKNLTPETPKSTKSNFRFAKGRKNQNESISADPAVKKRGPVSQPVDLDETQIQFESNPGPFRRKFWKLCFYSLWLEFPNCVQ